MAAVMREPVAIALLYQATNLHEHLKRALGELGARVVYDARAAEFNFAALNASGARVVVVNLDPEVEEEIDQLDELLAADHLHVVFNDGEVSSRLDGWDQARWARHLAAKILGAGDLNPPRPQGAQAIPVRVQSAAPAHPNVHHPDHAFELHGHELAAALDADTGESIRRTRAALVTKEEPIVPTLDDAFVRARELPSSERPTLEIPAGDLMQRIPVGGLSHSAPTPAAEPAKTPPVASTDIPGVGERVAARDEVAAEFADVLRDFGFTEDDAASSAVTATIEPDIADAPVRADSFSAALDPALAEPFEEPLSIEGMDDGAMDLAEIEASLNLSAEPAASAPADTESVESAETAAADDPFAGFDLGGLSLEPLDEESAAPTQRDAEPVRGLDDMLVDLVARSEDGKNQPAAAAKPGALKTPAPKPAPATPAAKPATAKPAVAETSKAASEPAPAPAAQRNVGKARELSDFDLSGLSLEPLGDEAAAASAPAGRARFDTPVKSEVPATKPATKPVVKPSAPATFALEPESVADDMSLPDLDFSLDDGVLAKSQSALEDEQGFLNEVSAIVAQPTSAPVAVDDPVKNVWVLGASIGGPEAVREFLAKVQPTTPALFLLAQHMGADFVELMTQQLARVTTLRVRHVQAGDTVAHGEVIVVPLNQRLLVDAQGKVELAPVDGMSSYSPSIDQVMTDAADRFGARAGAIIFSGMAHDAIDGAQYMAARGGKIWVQDPATCVISSMVDGARDAGVVSFVGAPAELARQIMVHFLR
jgi:chemotaxis response regulator CheB